MKKIKAKDKYNVCLQGIDKHTFSRIVSNVINNAVEATGDNKSRIEVELDRDDNFLIVKVKDEGPGISEENLNKVFERGFTTKDEGTGLGLAHAKEIIYKNGGFKKNERKNKFVVNLRT